MNKRKMQEKSHVLEFKMSIVGVIGNIHCTIETPRGCSGCGGEQNKKTNKNSPSPIVPISSFPCKTNCHFDTDIIV